MPSILLLLSVKHNHCFIYFRYPPPGHQHYRGPRPYSQHPRRTDSVQQSEYNDRNKYRINNLPYSQNRGYHHRGRQLPPFNHQQRQNDNHSETNYYQNSNQCHVNSMGDHDFRRQHQINPWANPSPAFENNRQYYDDHRSPQKTPRHIDMGDDIPDYTGHRPPASDHYTTTTTGSNNNNSQYSHSVDDTVDIIRKRLQNRDKQQNSESSIEHQNNADEDVRKNIKESYQNMPQEQPVRKKTQRQKQNIKSNCDKMKNKIVHQLFKMDKTKIHKLMDNPSSSSKFEYAISSLITEGQNSLNRHLRSAAEKSLCSSSTDFMQDDSNTIYEDTFMKQMQGILDPQDTVLLEDMKPLVMAELSRVLQLDDYQFEQLQEHGIQIQGLQDYEMQNNEIQSFTNENEIYELDETAHSQYYDEIQLNEQYSQDTFYEHSQASGSNAEEITADGNDRFYDYDQDSTVETKPFFERRSATKQVTENAYDNAKVYDTEKVYNTEKIYDTEKRRSAESRRSRNSIEISFANERETQNISSSRESKEQAHSIPLFDPNTDQLSEDDDPFAELDKQYHVAVDHNFIKYASRPSSPSQSNVSNSDKSPHFGCNAGIEIPNITVTSYIKNEIEAQLQDFVQLPIKYEPVSASTKDIADVHPTKEPEQVVEKQNLLAAPCKHVEIYSSPQEANTKKGVKKKHESTTPSKFVLQSNTRKRLTDQQPSHRKEKLKRSSQSECHEPAVMNMFFVHNPSKEVSKITNKPDSTSKTYSDKYVKRKATLRKYKVKEPSKTDNSNTSSHSMISPKDTASDTKPKSDKKKLKPIDIFESLTPKKTTIHLSHRNTAPVATTSQMVESSGDTKPKVPLKTSFARKLSKRHISTQVILKVKDNECQTEVQKQVKKITRKTQTEPVTIKSRDVSTNPLERMKEIDMEIQLLLQEKFKLYNSLETKAAEVPIDTIPSLSMRVFKVNTENIDEKSNDSEDAIVDDFTNIPTEELEQIAMETIIDQQPLTPSISTNRSRRQKVADLSRKSSASPTAKRINKRSKSPSISLIEEIITDNRPIEDIISLDDLETGPIKSKRKQKKQPKKKSAKKSKSSRVIFNTNAYSLKECSVVIKRIDISSYIKTKAPVLDKFTFKLPTENSVPETEDNFTSEKIEQEIIQDPGVTSMVNVVEDVNDLQFDMLDVSEDIVIGDNCEFKTIDKIKETITEEIILDNSQSSMEDGAPVSSSTENECKMYDYSNENLRRDAITVTGNADAVLAIEVSILILFLITSKDYRLLVKLFVGLYRGLVEYLMIVLQ